MRKKILLVDDAETSLLVERALLRNAPYDILVARNGREAVDKAIAEHPDLILMDVVMPQMTGFDACVEIKRHESTRDIPVILVTTRGEPESIETGYRSGCSDFLTKPFSPLELLSKLRSYLEG